MVLYTSAQAHHQGHISIKRNATSQTIAKSIMKAWHKNHTVNVLTLSLLKINTQNLIHVNLLSIRLVNKTSWFSRCTNARTKKMSTIPLIQLFVLHIQLPPDNVICQINVELEMIANLDFILHEYIQDTKNKHANLQLGLLLQPDLLALPPYKN